MSTHTPGPWIFRHRPFIKEGRLTIETARPDLIVAEILGTCSNDTTERDANARLIAAAPAMADALRKIADHCGEMQDRESGPSMHPAAKRLVDDAMLILKLSGEALALAADSTGTGGVTT